MKFSAFVLDLASVLNASKGVASHHVALRACQAQLSHQQQKGKEPAFTDDEPGKSNGQEDTVSGDKKSGRDHLSATAAAQDGSVVSMRRQAFSTETVGNDLKVGIQHYSDDAGDEHHPKAQKDANNQIAPDIDLNVFRTKRVAMMLGAGPKKGFLYGDRARIYPFPRASLPAASRNLRTCGDVLVGGSKALEASNKVMDQAIRVIDEYRVFDMYGTGPSKRGLLGSVPLSETFSRQAETKAEFMAADEVFALGKEHLGRGDQLLDEGLREVETYEDSNIPIYNLETGRYEAETGALNVEQVVAEGDELLEAGDCLTWDVKEALGTRFEWSTEDNDVIHEQAQKTEPDINFIVMEGEKLLERCDQLIQDVAEALEAHEDLEIDEHSPRPQEIETRTLKVAQAFARGEDLLEGGGEKLIRDVTIALEAYDDLKLLTEGSGREPNKPGSGRLGVKWAEKIASQGDDLLDTGDQLITTVKSATDFYNYEEGVPSHEAEIGLPDLDSVLSRGDELLETSDELAGDVMSALEVYDDLKTAADGNMEALQEDKTEFLDVEKGVEKAEELLVLGDQLLEHGLKQVDDHEYRAITSQTLSTGYNVIAASSRLVEEVEQASKGTSKILSGSKAGPMSEEPVSVSTAKTWATPDSLSPSTSQTLEPNPLRSHSHTYTLRESRVPSSRLSRLWSYGGLAAGMLGGALTETVSRTFGNSKDDSGSVVLSSANTKRLVAKLSRMRGAALKIGQMMSFQDAKMLPPAIQEVLQRVQDRADYMPSWQRNKVLTENLGKDWRDMFQTFEETPIAAASIGQVHRARLRASNGGEGKEVAVKIQFPGVADSINSDLDNLSMLLTASRLLPKGLYLDKTIKNARTELAWECDYKREGACAARYKRLLADEDDVFVVPNIYPEASGDHVLTMEYMKGVGVTRILEFSQDQRDWIGSQILRLCLREIAEFKFMQTDPNWTNFLYNVDSKKLELLDFGASRDFPPRFVDLYVRLLIAASKLDREAVKKLSEDLGYLTGHESKNMLKAHVDSVLTLAEPFLESAPKIYDFRNQTITDRVRGYIPTMVRERLSPPPEETYSLHRKLSGAFLLCARLGSRVPCRQLFVECVNRNGYLKNEGEPEDDDVD